VVLFPIGTSTIQTRSSNLFKDSFHCEEEKMTSQSSVAVEEPGIPWWVVLIEGIAAIILGIFLFLRPAATTIVLIQFLGIYWLITGIFSIISLIWNRTAWGWKIFSGILGIIAGALIIQNPLWSTLLVPTTLALVLGATGIVIGIIQLIQAFSGAGWGTGILGVLSILLGFLLITRPVLAGLALPWVLAGLLIVGGFLAIIVAFSLRNAVKRVAASGAPPASRVAPPPVPVTGSPAAPVATAPAAPTSSAATGVMDTTLGTAAAAGVAGLAAAGAEAAQEPEESGSSEAGESMGMASGSIEEAVGASASFAVEAPAESLTGNVDPADPEEMAKFKYSLEYVEGIGPVYAGRLKVIGLETCLDLLKTGASRKGRETIAAESEIPDSLILKWVNHVDLYRIKGVGSEYADLLEASGVDTVVELAQRNPTNLFEKINEVNAEKALVRKMPTESQVEDWISQAKGLPRVVSY
jgi:uncharacterized membrane protein HdeD (DUF308 family)/predicted flap endonuclease-1-like 5' DNA nuclease